MTRPIAQRWLTFGFLLAIATMLFFASGGTFRFAFFNFGETLPLMAAGMVALMISVMTFAAPTSRAGRIARISMSLIAVPLVLAGAVELVDSGGHPSGGAMLWMVFGAAAPLAVPISLLCLTVANAQSEQWKFLICGITLCLTIAIGTLSRG